MPVICEGMLGTCSSVSVCYLVALSACLVMGYADIHAYVLQHHDRKPTGKEACLLPVHGYALYTPGLTDYVESCVCAS